MSNQQVTHVTQKPNNQAPPNKHLKKLGLLSDYVWKFIKHPATALVLSLALFPLGLQLSKTEKKPVFAISSPSLIAKSVNNEDKLKISWEGKSIPLASTIKIAIWNQGSQFIDGTDFSSKEPIRIQPSDKSIEILTVQPLSTSRANLKFLTSIRKDINGYSSVVINIEGDEALEKSDGALFQILFTTTSVKNLCECKWFVSGRIKGVPEGFQQKNWNKVSGSNSFIAWFSLIVVILLAFMLCITIVQSVKEMVKGHKIGKSKLLKSYYIQEYCVATHILSLMKISTRFS